MVGSCAQGVIRCRLPDGRAMKGLAVVFLMGGCGFADVEGVPGGWA